MIPTRVPGLWGCGAEFSRTPSRPGPGPSHRDRDGPGPGPLADLYPGRARAWAGVRELRVGTPLGA